MAKRKWDNNSIPMIYIPFLPRQVRDKEGNYVLVWKSPFSLKRDKKEPNVCLVVSFFHRGLSYLRNTVIFSTVTRFFTILYHSMTALITFSCLQDKYVGKKEVGGKKTQFNKSFQSRSYLHKTSFMRLCFSIQRDMFEVKDAGKC